MKKIFADLQTKLKKGSMFKKELGGFMHNRLTYGLTLLVALTSCGETTTTVTTSSDATIASVTFTADDSIPGLAAASFTIEDRIDTGLIYNQDSLLFGTRIDSVIPVFRFNATPANVVIYSDTDTIIYSTGDTINFVPRPVYIQVLASDETTIKWYEMYVNVHQVDPDLYIWERICPGVFMLDGAEQKSVYLNQTFFMYVNDGLTLSAYSSSNAHLWNTVTCNLPASCEVSKIVHMDNTLYYPDMSQIYTSTDGLAWTAVDCSSCDFTFVNFLYKFDDKLWAIVKDKTGDKYYLASSADGTSWAKDTDSFAELPADFPVSDYSALTFQSASGRKRAMIVGGYNAIGQSLNTRWNVETSSEGYHWTNFSIEQPSFKSLTGVSVIYYNNQFLMFGGVDADNQIGEYDILQSFDEGMNWYEPDSTKNKLPDTYQPRQKQSVIVDENNFIYIIGGQSRTKIFSDVYRGKLNSIDW